MLGRVFDRIGADQVAYDEAFFDCSQHAVVNGPPTRSKPLAIKFIDDAESTCAVIADARVGQGRGNGVDQRDDDWLSLCDHALFFSKTTKDPADALISSMALITVLHKDEQIRCDTRFKCAEDDTTCAGWRRFAESQCKDAASVFKPYLDSLIKRNERNSDKK